MEKENNSLQVVTKEIVKGKFNVALTKAQTGIQNLSNEEASLVYNEDNLEKIKSFLEKGKKAVKVVEEEFTLVKKPVLEQTKVIDESKREILSQINTPLLRATTKYNDLCNEIQKRAIAQQQEKERKERISKGIDENMIVLSQKIADCTTSKQLVEIQNFINLQKGAPQNLSKYQEFLPVYRERLEGLNESINAQKEKIKTLEKLSKQHASAKSDEAREELAEQINNVKEDIEEGKVVVQNTALNQASAIHIEDAEEVMPVVKAKRSVWKYEVVDINLLAKKMPHLTRVVADDEAIFLLLETKKVDGSLDGKQEVILNGIKFYLQKTF